MRHLTRCEYRIARFEAEPLMPDLEQELAFQGVEPLVLVVMQVARRAALRVERVLKDKEAAGALPGHLEGNGANAESPRFTEEVCACSDRDDRWITSRSV